MAFDKVRFVITNNKILINKGNNKITELQTIYICIQFGWIACQQTIHIPMGANCAPLPADAFLHAYETYFLDI
jgi:hypothetical protein